MGVTVRMKGENLSIQAPQGVLTDALRARIASRKSDIIAALPGQAEPAPPRAVPQPGERHTLSHFQQRLWIIQQLDPAGSEYNLVTVWPMSEFEPDHVAAAVMAVVERHAILRTAFQEGTEGPEAVILGGDAVEIARQDLSGALPGGQLDVIGREIDRHVEIPFDLGTGAPIRFVVFDLGPQGSALLVAAHHIALDHWSLSLLRAEIRSAAADPGAIGTPPALQYAEYAAWSREALGQSHLAAGLDWWEARLSGHPELCAFPTDRLPDLRARGGSHSFTWDPDLSDGIRTLARENGASLWMCLVAACAVAIHLHTGLEDIVIGNPVATRERPEFEGVIGPFVNTLALRLDVGAEDGFGDVLARARDAFLDAHAHRDIPFELVIDRLQPARSFNRSPLFQVAVVLQDGSGGQQEPIYGGGAVHDLTWFVRELDGRLVGAIEYRADMYRADTVRRLSERLETILRQAVERPDVSVGRFSLLTAEERHTQTTTFCPAPRETGDTPFPRQFEAVAARNAEQPAVTFEGATLSYGELNARANRIARLLGDRGIRPRDVVGLCIERSTDMLAALIGLQKAGAVYVPLDPAFPATRLDLIAADSNATAIVGDRRSLRRFDGDGPVALIALDDEGAALAGLAAENLDTAPAPEDPSHIIYTSGSTGTPKGVVIRHGAVANLLGSLRQEPGIAADDIVAATTTVSFDIAAVELLLPLTVGARVALMSRDTATDGFAWSEALQATGATVVQATPSAWKLLLEADWPGRSDILAITGGEPLTRDLADSLLARVDRLWNGYGPSETTIYSTGGWIERGTDAVSIGRPVANTRVFVLDQRGDLAPIGLQGEICIGGAGVSEGYVGREAETEARFVPDPFGGSDGARLYRTGDLGRWSPDGRLYHLGRSDHQVKVRGARVELGEIEAALVATQGISEAVVLARSTGGDDRRLVAYVVYEAGAEMTASEVRRSLNARLPRYMVPPIVVEMPNLPRLTNGKLDRRSLPDPFAQSAEPSRHVPPAAGVETTLAAIWSDVLSIERIGAADNFFELGGHSLLTLRVSKAVEAELGVFLDPRLMFLKNLRQIAAQISEQETAAKVQ